MIRTIEAIVDEQGTVRLLETVTLPQERRALVTILDEPPGIPHETALLSEAALQDWNRPEEEAAWSTYSRRDSAGALSIFGFISDALASCCGIGGRRARRLGALSGYQQRLFRSTGS